MVMQVNMKQRLVQQRVSVTYDSFLKGPVESGR